MLSILSISILLVISQFNASLLVLPKFAMFETLICRAYYRNVAPQVAGLQDSMVFDESSCKLPTIQQELSTILGVMVAFDSIPGRLFLGRSRASVTANDEGILMGTYFQGLAYKHGRKPILILSLLGETIALMWRIGIGRFA